MITCWLYKPNISCTFWFMLDLWHLKYPCANLDPNLFLHKCQQQQTYKRSKVRTAWVVVGAPSNKLVKVAYCTKWPLLLLRIEIKEKFEKWLKILNRQDPSYFLFVLMVVLLVYHLPLLFHFFDAGARS